MTVVALMWEARAPQHHGDDLLTWVRQQNPPNPAGPAPLRRETLRAPQDRVLVITWWNAPYDADLPELPDPPAHLVTRPVHRWRFESVGE
jgi:hypothetical protein